MPKIFRSIIGEETLDEFDLMTLLTEVERILNDRTLTELHLFRPISQF